MRPVFIIALRSTPRSIWQFHAAFAPNAYDLAEESMWRLATVARELPSDTICLVDWRGNCKTV